MWTLLQGAAILLGAVWAIAEHGLLGLAGVVGLLVLGVICLR